MDSKIASITLSLEDVIDIRQSDSWVLSTMKEHGPLLVGMLWRILGNEDDVCDAYQETFLQLANCGEKLKPFNAKAYIFKTASNTAISIIRRRQVEERFKKNFAVNAAQDCQEAGNNEFDSGQLCQELRKQISQLPEVLRNVIMLHDLGELSYDNVGQILGLTAGTVRVYRFKAVQLLAVWMDKKNEQ